MNKDIAEQYGATYTPSGATTPTSGLPSMADQMRDQYAGTVDNSQRRQGVSLSPEQSAAFLGQTTTATDTYLQQQAQPKLGDVGQVLGAAAETLNPVTLVKTAGKFVKSAVRSPVDIVRGLFGMKPYQTEAEKAGMDMPTIQSQFAEETVPAVEAGTTSPLEATAGILGETVGGGATILGAKPAKELLTEGASFLKQTAKKTTEKLIGQKTATQILSTPESQVYKLNPVERKYYFDNQKGKVSLTRETAEAQISKDLENKMTKVQEEAEALKREVDVASRDEVLRLRPKIREAMGKQSEEYRRLVDEDLAPHVDTKVSAKEMRDFVFSKYNDNPDLGNAIINKLGLESDFKPSTTLGEIYEKSRGLRQEMGVASKKGTRVYTADEKLADDAIHTLTDYMSSKGVDLSRARSFWAKYAPVRNQLVTEAKPFLQTDTQTKTFAQTLKRVAEGKDVNNENFISEVEDLVDEPIGKDIKSGIAKLTANEKKALATKLESEVSKSEALMKEDKALKALSEKEFEIERLARRRKIIKTALAGTFVVGGGLDWLRRKFSISDENRNQ